VDVQYDGQVIGTKEKISKVDSVQLRKNIERLLQEAKDMRQDTTLEYPATKNINLERQPAPQASVSEIETTNTATSRTTSNAKPKLIDRKPKAVMPAKNE